MMQEYGWVVLNNRNRGAKKAAATQVRNLASKSVGNCEETTEYYCGLCGKQYIDETGIEELWNACNV